MKHYRSFGLGMLVLGAVAGCASTELKQANRLAEEGKWEEAVTAYQEAQRKAPFDDRIRQRLDRAKSAAADRHYTNGKQALDERRLPEALQSFKLALGLDPAKAEHHAAIGEALRLKESQDQLQAGKKLQNLGRVEEALTAFERTVELDPSQTDALTQITELTKQQRAIKQIGASQEPLTLRFQQAKLKEVFEILARTAGVNVLFDKEVRDEPITIFIKDLPFDDALQLILNTNGLVAQHVAPETILVMPNNKQKQAQYQDLLMRTFYLANAKAKDAVNLVRTMLDSKKVYVDDKVNAIVVRDEPAKLQLAEKLLFAIDRRDPEVELDVEVLEVNRTKSMKYGINFAKQLGFGIRPGTSGGISTAPATFTLQQLTALAPQSYLFTLPASLLTDFFKQQSDAKTLASPKLRVLNNKSASINVGDKQPILLSTTNVLPGQAATGAIPTTSTVTSIEFKDVGVKLTVEPSINALDEIAMKLKIEVTRLGDQVILQASPEIKQFKFGTRSAETFLMMRDDETVVLGGLIQGEDRKNRSSVPILGDIPYVGELFTATTVDRVDTEVVLTITPRIVRSLATPPIAEQVFWSGTDQTYATTQLFPPHARTVSQSTRPDASAGPMTKSAEQSSTTSVSTSRTVPAPSPTTTQPPPTAQVMRPQPGGEPVAAPAPTPATTIASPDSRPSATARSAQANAGNVRAEGEAPASDLVARGPALIQLSPSELSTMVGQEFRVDLSTATLDALTESMITVSYDPTLVEFRRVGPGAAAISARSLDGQVILTLRRQGQGGTGDRVLAMLFFHAKAKGEVTVTMDTVAQGAGAPARTERALVRVQ